MHSNPQGPVPRVLLVDDAPDNRLLMSLYVRRSGVEILTARNGEEALQVAASMLPDLVVLDLAMTGMSCYEVASASNPIPQHRSLPSYS
jgi:CheY-like chemotaxis protein